MTSNAEASKAKVRQAQMGKADVWEPLQRRSGMAQRTIALTALTLAITIAPTAMAASNPTGVWNGKSPSLPTPWTAEVSPRNALPEYPRPQLARPSLDHPKWMSLNG